jgi:3'(2'), 5'-bisphosphate nucleotidase
VRADSAKSNDLGPAGDLASQTYLMTALAKRYPADAVLSEEGEDDRLRLGRHRVWIVDPLDGTREFAEPPRDDWAVHVALVVDGIAVAGAVSLPARGLTLDTARPPLPTAPGATLRVAVSRTRPSEHAGLVARRLGAELVPMGSAGAKAMAVVLGEADIYLHSGGMYEWDSAAPVAVAVSCGLHASRLDGSPLRYNQPDPWLPDLLICRPELADIVVELCEKG